MAERFRSALVLALFCAALGCSSGSSGDDQPAAAGVGGVGGAITPPPVGIAGTPMAPVMQPGAAGTTVPVGGSGGSAGSMMVAGMGGMGGMGGSKAGSGGSAGSAGAAGSTAGSGGSAGSAGSGMPMDNGSNLTGTLGALGAVKPVVNGWATTNGLETLIYLTSAPLTCAQMMTMGVKWLPGLPAGTQVIEIVVRGTAMVGTTQVGLFQGEVNYAEGSKSSSYEVVGSSGSIMFTKAEDKKVYEGMIMATFPMGMVSGTFHADWCEGGTEY